MEVPETVFVNRCFDSLAVSIVLQLAALYISAPATCLMSDIVLAFPNHLLHCKLTATNPNLKNR